MSLGAAVGGFAKGLAGGLKLSSELEDAEERRGLMRLQRESAQLQINRDREEEAYRREKKEMLNNLLNPTQQAPEVPQIGDDGLGIPPKPGIKGPSQPGMFEGNNASINDLGTLTKLNNAITYLDAKYGKIGVKELLDGAQRYRALQQEGVLDAWQKVAAGDYDGAIQTFNSTGRFKLPEGTRFEARQEDDGFGAGRKITNYYAISPDGREVNYRDMMRNTLPPEKLMELDSATGYRIADLGLKRTAEENAENRAKRLYDLTTLKYDKLIEEQRAQTKIALERLGLAKDDAKYANIQRGLLGAQADLTNLIITNKKFDPSMASDDDKKRHAAELTALGGAESIFQMNFDLNKGKAGLAPTQALDVWKSAARDPSTVKIDEQTGFGYVEYGNKKVFVPRSMAPQASPAPAAAPAPRPGIKVPEGPTVAGRPLYNYNQRDLERIATRPRGISFAEAAEAQAELDARRTEGGRIGPVR